MLGTFGMLIAAAVIHLEEVRGVNEEELLELGAALERSIGNAAGTVAAVLPRESLECPLEASCVELIREKTGVREVIVARVLGIPSLVRVLVERAETGASVKIDLPRGARAEWSARLDELGRELFPKPAVSVPRPIERLVAVPPPPPPPPQLAASSPIPWMLIGVGAIALGTGVVFGVQNASARDEGRVSMDPVRVEELRDRAFATGLAANVLFGVAAIGVSAGVGWLVFE